MDGVTNDDTTDDTAVFLCWVLLDHNWQQLDAGTVPGSMCGGTGRSWPDSKTTVAQETELAVGNALIWVGGFSAVLTGISW
jgi:hypothetical protein